MALQVQEHADEKAYLIPLESAHNLLAWLLQRPGRKSWGQEWLPCCAEVDATKLAFNGLTDKFLV